MSEFNVEFIERFLDCETSEQTFAELSRLPFKKHEITVCGRKFTPERELFAFSDDGITYPFSGIRLEGEPWTPEMLQLKKRVEALSGAVFNHCVVTLYPDGSAKIGSHSDDEGCLNSKAPIACISLGATRTLLFTRRDEEARRFALTDGSVYFMHPPTNYFFRHAIIAEPDVVKPRISLTFRQVISTPKRKFSEMSMDEKEIEAEDWLTRHNNESNPLPPLNEATTLKYWDLGHCARVSVVQYLGCVKIHIREYSQGGLPTKSGVALTPATWEALTSEIHGLDIRDRKSGFIANRCLIVNIADDQFVVMQQFFHDVKFVLHFKQNTGLKLLAQQIESLQSVCEEVSDFVLEYLYGNYVRVLLTSQIHVKTSAIIAWNNPHPPPQDYIAKFFELFKNSVCSWVIRHFKCPACLCGSMGQAKHDCLNLSVNQKYQNFKSEVWFNLDVKKIIGEFISILPNGVIHSNFLHQYVEFDRIVEEVVKLMGDY